MKVKKITIGIKPTREFMAEAEKSMKRMAKGEKVARETGVFFEDLTTMRKVMTEKRLELVRVIKRKKPSSVYALAKLLGRDLKNVMKDLEYLEAVGLVDLRKSRSGRGETVPSVKYDKIELEIAV
ncbi:MAG: hypothetical protein IEMM0002_1459 [bacterium]|nr:MAG: hypothetical protein IEMM0002_1459 [bacterium]